MIYLVIYLETTLIFSYIGKYAVLRAKAGMEMKTETKAETGTGEFGNSPGSADLTDRVSSINSVSPAKTGAGCGTVSETTGKGQMITEQKTTEKKTTEQVVAKEWATAEWAIEAIDRSFIAFINRDEFESLRTLSGKGQVTALRSDISDIRVRIMNEYDFQDLIKEIREIARTGCSCR